MGWRKQSASAVVGTILTQLLLRCDDAHLSTIDNMLRDSDANTPPSLEVLLDILQQVASDNTMRSETVILLDEWEVKNMENVADFIKTLEVLRNLSWRLFITSRASSEAPIPDSLETCHFDVTPDQVKSIAVTFSRPESPASISTSQLVLSLADSRRSRSGSNPVNQPGRCVVEPRLCTLIARADLLFCRFFFLRSITDIMVDRISTEGVNSSLAISQALDLVERQSLKDLNLAKTVLIWLANVHRPLAIESLCEALAVDHTQLQLNRSAAPTADSVITCCQGLTKIDDHDMVSLTHPDIGQCLSSHWSKDYKKVKTDLSITCLAYVLLATFVDGPSAHQEVVLARFHEYPFLSYAADNWAAHAQETQSKEIHDLVMDLFNQPNKLASAMQMKECRNLSATSDSNEFEAAAQRVRSMSALQMAVRLDLRDVVHVLLQKHADVMQLDTQGFAILDEALRGKDWNLFQTLYEKAAINTRGPSDGLAIKLHPRVKTSAV